MNHLHYPKLCTQILTLLRLCSQPWRCRQLFLWRPAGWHHPHGHRWALWQHAWLHDPAGAEETQGKSETGLLVWAESEMPGTRKFHTCFFFSSSQNSNYESIQQTARSIAEQAHVLAYDPNYMSPFAQFACDNGLNVRGKCLGFTYTKWQLNHIFAHISNSAVVSVQEESQTTSQCCCP